MIRLYREQHLSSGMKWSFPYILIINIINSILFYLNYSLLNWIQSKLPDMPIKNFTHDWTTGKPVGALVDACAPGLCPDWELWDPNDAVANATEAMTLADDWLDVRQLINPEELVDPNVDEQSVLNISVRIHNIDFNIT